MVRRTTDCDLTIMCPESLSTSRQQSRPLRGLAALLAVGQRVLTAIGLKKDHAAVPARQMRAGQHITLPVWIMGRLGLFCVVGIMTLCSSLMAVFVSWMFSLVFEVPDRPLCLALAFTIPLFVTPVFGWLTAISIRDLQRSRKKAVDLARIDTLTGLQNRRAFFEAARKASEKPDAAHGSNGVLYIDIDHFKSINDRHGHEGGDVVLKHFAGLLSACTRSSDLVARIGGEEFVIHVADIGSAGLAAIANGVMARVRASEVEFADSRIRYTVSIGGVLGSGSLSIDRLLSLADGQLYEVKHAGRNGFQLVDARVPAAPAVPETARASRSAA